jgi:predicted TIM-barrel fold metal-dependent hydrolase
MNRTFLISVWAAAVIAGGFAGACHSSKNTPLPISKFDVHTHLSPGSIERTLRIFDANGITKAVNLSGGRNRKQLASQLAEAGKARGRILVFVNIDFRGALQPGWVENQVRWLQMAKQMGARGLKIEKVLGLGVYGPAGQRVPVDDPGLDPIYEEAGRLGFPVAEHVGDPKAFFDPVTEKNERYEELSLNPGWSFADRTQFPDWETLFGEWSRRVARHPHTTFIGVHFGNDPEEPARVAAMLAANPNLVLDTAARVPEIGRYPAAKLREIFITYRNRILFGTDLGVSLDDLMLGCPEPEPQDEKDAVRFYNAHWAFFETNATKLTHPSPIQGHWTVDGIGLPRDVLEDFYHGNAERLFAEGAAKPEGR